MPGNFIQLGVDSLDADHQRLADIVTGLSDLYERGGDQGEAVRLIRALVAESEAHFAREEEEMQRTSYPLAAVHGEEHGNLIEALRSIAAEFEATQQALDKALLDDLWEWLNHHVSGSDRAFSEHLKSVSLVGG